LAASLACRVRRSSDNAELNIGFTASGDLNTAALLAHVGSGSGFVTTWYDQSGNGRNATQTTAGSQPRIVNAGVLETQNGKPALRLLASQLNIAPISFTSVYVGAVAAVTAASADDNGSVVLFAPAVGLIYNGLMGFGSGGPTIRFRVRFPDAGSSFEYANPINTNTLMSYTAQGVADIRYFINGTQQATDTSASTLSPVIGIGGLHATQCLRDGTVQEVAVFPSVLSTTDRQTLERNQGAYYGIAVA
jgi:hypothetical protein